MNNKLEYPYCNFCGHSEYEVIWEKVTTWISDGYYRIICCKNCKLVYVSPRPKNIYITKYYPAETYWGIDVINSESNDELKKRNTYYGYLYRQILKRKKIGHILDLGAGMGLFLTKFKDLKWKIDGVELSKEACKYAQRAYGLNIVNGSFPEFKLPSENYDVITFNACLEHLYKPKEALVKAYHLLKKHGFVEITVPNFNSLGRLIFGKNWYALLPPTHLYHFTPKSIKAVLKEIGFKDVEIGYNYWAHNQYILFESIRLAFSPRFKGKGLKSYAGAKFSQKEKKFLIQLEIGKILAKLSSYTLSILGSIVRRSEVMTIYAKKDE